MFETICVNSGSFHLRCFKTQSRAYSLPFPLYFSLFSPEVRVDRRHGWVVTPKDLGLCVWAKRIQEAVKAQRCIFAGLFFMLLLK